MEKEEQRRRAVHIGGFAGWLMTRWRGRQAAKPRLELLERITLAPRQSLALVEAEGRRILVATSAEGAPAFFLFGEKNETENRARNGAPQGSRIAARQARVSW